MWSSATQHSFDTALCETRTRPSSIFKRDLFRDRVANTLRFSSCHSGESSRHRLLSVDEDRPFLAGDLKHFTHAPVERFGVFVCPLSSTKPTPQRRSYPLQPETFVVVDDFKEPVTAYGLDSDRFTVCFLPKTKSNDNSIFEGGRSGTLVETRKNAWSICFFASLSFVTGTTCEIFRRSAWLLWNGNKRTFSERHVKKHGSPETKVGKSAFLG